MIIFFPRKDAAEFKTEPTCINSAILRNIRPWIEKKIEDVRIQDITYKLPIAIPKAGDAMKRFRIKSFTSKKITRL